MITRKNAAEIFGWYGTIAILLAYALISFKIIKSDSLIYQLLNLSGALGIVTISAVKKVRQPAILNLAWAVIACIAIVGLMIH
jgi:uncharacterized YccA/Bax inhibitor family protein